MSIERVANVNKYIVYEAGKDALKKMNPKVMARNHIGLCTISLEWLHINKKRRSNCQAVGR
ncbi:hypothetical protein E2R55_03650 [Vibrio vulnificus]|nr:hypothetical protein E2R55_03650 [Vibrio vulnificus]